jgi:hypothetical protein
MFLFGLDRTEVFLEGFIGSEFRKKFNGLSICDWSQWRHTDRRGLFTQSRPSICLGELSDPTIQAPDFLLAWIRGFESRCVSSVLGNTI